MCLGAIDRQSRVVGIIIGDRGLHELMQYLTAKRFASVGGIW